MAAAAWCARPLAMLRLMGLLRWWRRKSLRRGRAKEVRSAGQSRTASGGVFDASAIFAAGDVRGA